MKRILTFLSFVLILALGISFFASCGKTPEKTGDVKNTDPSSKISEETASAPDDGSATATASSGTTEDGETEYEGDDRLCGVWKSTLDMRATAMRFMVDPSFEALPEMTVTMTYTFTKNGRMTAVISSDEDDATFLAQYRAFRIKTAELSLTLAAKQHGYTVEEYMKENGIEGTLEDFGKRMYDDADPSLQDIRGVYQETAYRVAGDKIYLIEDQDAAGFPNMDEKDRDNLFTYFIFEFDESGRMIWSKTNRPDTMTMPPITLVKE